MTFPIGMIPYANMAPFQKMGPPEGCRFVNCLPRDSIQALKEKRILAAAVPVGGLAALEKITLFLGSYGIAVNGKAMSVLFFSDRPFSQFARPLTVGLTGESASSVRLLYLLLGYAHGFDRVPLLATQAGPSNGYLVIGDRALRWAREFEATGSVHGYTHVMDLADEWHKRCQLPFVFARWVIHKEAPQALRHLVDHWLEKFSREEDMLIQKATPLVAAQMKLPQAYVEQYLRVIRRCLTPHDEAGQQHFLSELKRHGTPSLYTPADGASGYVASQEHP